MKLSRRRFIEAAGALTGGALLGLPRFAQGDPPTLAQLNNVITVFANGGWDTTCALDPKMDTDKITPPPGVEAEHSGPGGTLNYFRLAGAAGDAVATFFTNHGDLAAIIRGINIRTISHSGCNKRMLTGTSSEKSPDLAAIVARYADDAARNEGVSVAVPYMVLGSRAFTGPYAYLSGRLGMSSQLLRVMDPAQAYEVEGFVPALANPANRRPSGADEGAVIEYLRARAERLRVDGGRAQHGYNKKRVQDYLRSLDTRGELASYADEFSGGNEGGPTLNIAFARQAALAVVMLKEQVSWTVSVDADLNWDTHDANHGRQARSHQELFIGLNALVQGLKATDSPRAGYGKLIEHTTVYVVSEMSRTPLLNYPDEYDPENAMTDALRGKDHWPVTSCMALGAGVAGGKAYGATKDDAYAELVDYGTGAPADDGVGVYTENFAGGLLRCAGLGDTEITDHLGNVPIFGPFAG